MGGDTIWRVTAEDIDHVLHGDVQAVEVLLRMLDKMALAGGEYVIRCRFPGPLDGGGFEFVVRRRGWLTRALWWLGTRRV